MFESYTKGCSTKRGSGPGITGGPRRTSEFQYMKFERDSVTLCGDVRYWIENNTYYAG